MIQLGSLSQSNQNISNQNVERQKVKIFTDLQLKMVI